MSSNNKDSKDKCKIAHIDKDRVRKQTVKEHLINVGDIAKKFCEDYEVPGTDASEYAKQVGLAHDIGKYSEAFYRKIENGENISVDHSTAGAKELCNMKMVWGAFAIAGHHGGIPNGIDTTESSFVSRTRKNIEDYSEYSEEIELNKVADTAFEREKEYENSFFTRMLYSALVDADFIDTEAFMSNGEVKRGEYDSLKMLYNKLMKKIEPWRIDSDNKSEIDKIRTVILEKCIRAGMGEQGLYSLTVPTGGGKTVSSLAFALQHAVTYNKKRIIYVIPYTSIIEQNVTVFRDILGNNNVLAHYSEALAKEEKSIDDIKDINKRRKKQREYEMHKLSIENWDAPVIVTTNVQFFESLYANRVSKCRKLHNIANSVIIFDEAQMIPLNYLKPCVKAIQSLVEYYKVTAVLCTATQPSLDKYFLPLKIYEIIPEYKKLFEKLKRTNIQPVEKMEEGVLINHIKQNYEALIIVNKKDTAHSLYKRIQEDGVYHLSNYMIPIDKMRVLNKIKSALNNNDKCIVISTSLVEAGVNLDFPVVYREIAGLDSIIQAAGRCNREGKREVDKCVTYVFELEDSINEKIHKNAIITHEIVEKYGEYYDLQSIKAYFEAIQALDDEYLDQKNIINSFKNSLEGIRLPFKRVAEVFHIIEDNTKMLIIPIDEEANQLVNEIERRKKEGESFMDSMRKLGEYSINIYNNQYDKLIEENISYEIFDGVAVLQKLDMYSNDKGFEYEKMSGASII